MTAGRPYSKVNTLPGRAVHDEAWIKDLLQRVPTGTLATAILDESGVPQPFVSTLLFAYDEARHAVYLHAARRGRVWENVKMNNRVSFTAAEIGRLLPAATALNFSMEYASIVIFGQIALVEDPAEAESALQQILDKYFPHLKPGQDYRPITQAEIDATAVYRLDIAEWSGKRKVQEGAPAEP